MVTQRVTENLDLDIGKKINRHVFTIFALVIYKRGVGAYQKKIEA